MAGPYTPDCRRSRKYIRTYVTQRLHPSTPEIAKIQFGNFFFFPRFRRARQTKNTIAWIIIADYAKISRRRTRPPFGPSGFGSDYLGSKYVGYEKAVEQKYLVDRRCSARGGQNFFFPTGGRSKLYLKYNSRSREGGRFSSHLYPKRILDFSRPRATSFVDKMSDSSRALSYHVGYHYGIRDNP